MTIEEAYAEPVTRKKRRDRAFTIGILVGIVAGVIATLLLNRAAEDDLLLDDEPVVELQPAIVPPVTTSRPARSPTRGGDGMSGQTTRRPPPHRGQVPDHRPDYRLVLRAARGRADAQGVYRVAARPFRRARRQ